MATGSARKRQGRRAERDRDAKPKQGSRPAGRAKGAPPDGVDARSRRARPSTKPVATRPAEAAEPESPSATGPAERPLTIVGVGMSAGGLEACSQLLESLPSSPGFAIVLVQHLSPHHASALPVLLGARTQMVVTEAEDGSPVDADRIYVIPPDVAIELVDGRLKLSPRSDEPGHLLPVDYFLKSLAASLGDRAVGVILSGTGSDGVIGGRAIKAQGGTLLVQEPSTAKYDGMPRAAITAGLADVVAPPAVIAEKLVDLAGHAFAEGAGTALDRLPVTEEQLGEILELLRSASGGVDFSHYKQPTIRRRLLRRMALNRVGDIGAYLDLVRQQPEEARSLYQDILIHVTRFFREPESFDSLARDVLPKLIQGRKPDNPVRMWVAGCATGEEAYSLAITLWEVAGDTAAELNVQIFGTDVSETAIEFARQGLYPVGIADDIPSERLRRFFTKVDGEFRISKAIRDHCVFARQDLTRDPPFSKLDLILCRNVLIYMDITLQRKLVPIFHYALRPEGYLVLGHAETVGMQNDLFALVDKKHKVYRKKPADHPLAMPMPAYSLPRTPSLAAPAPKSRPDPRLVQNEANRILLDRFSPPGVLVDENLDVIQFRGRTGPFLEPPPGDASLNLLKLAREGLLHGLRSAVQSARKSRKAVRLEALRVLSNGGWTEVDLEVVPLAGVHNPHYLVLFEPRERRRPRARPSPAPAPPRARAGNAARAEQELAATREYLQSIIQEVEAANEELQSANEEILSSNEELQSTNEELDTAKEELQSTNEELNTLNDELHARNEELTRVNSDLVNLLGSVQIAVVIVTNELRIRRFTPVAEKMLNLIPADVGRPITQVRPNIDCPQLGDLILEVIDRVSPIEREVLDQEGRWYSLRIRPYKGLENKIEGAVIALVDIDAAKRHEMEIQEARRQAEAIVAAVAQPLAVLDGSFRIRSVNSAFARMLRLSAGEARGRTVYEIGEGRLDVPGLHQLLERTLAQPKESDESQRAVLGGGGGELSVYARPLDAWGEGERFILLGVEKESPGRP
jgi:two-component system, chemotaxis family, CheB/CheR fusion protein